MPPSLTDYARVTLRALLAPGPATTGLYRGWVRPRYVDVNLHMNYGAYLEVMELARLDWLVRNGLLRVWLRRRWQPVVGSMHIDYRRELKPWRRFEVHTRALGFDRKALVLEQRVTSAEGEHAVATLNTVLRGPGGVVSREALEPTVAALLPR